MSERNIYVAVDMANIELLILQQVWMFSVMCGPSCCGIEVIAISLKVVQE